MKIELSVNEAIEFIKYLIEKNEQLQQIENSEFMKKIIDPDVYKKWCENKRADKDTDDFEVISWVRKKDNEP